MHLVRYCFVLILFHSALSPAADITTSFEFNDSSGSFTLGTPPNTAVFTNGMAKSVGIFSLYHSGSRSWMIDSGNTGTVNFNSPVGEVSFFIRSQSGNTGELRIYNSDDQLLLTQNSGNSWVEVAFSVAEGEAGIARLELQNSSGSGYTVMDDFVCTALSTPIPDEEDPLEDPIPMPISLGMAMVKLQVLATGLTAPNWGTYIPGNEKELMVTDQPGVVWAIDLDSGAKRTFLDVSDRLISLGVFDAESYDERGLLGLAFHPRYSDNGLLYTYTSEPVTGSADFTTLPEGLSPNHHSVVTEWRVLDMTDPQTVVDSGSARVILRIEQPQFNHNGGALAFGPDGMLYISLGDGGGADDVDGQEFLEQPIIGHGDGNGQDASNILGSLLRIDIDSSNSANGNYGIPAGNPFVSDASMLDEIYAYGFRNPFRFSFDRDSGLLYLADIGQNDIEEIDIVMPGFNYGWNTMEGSFRFQDNGNDDGFVTAPPDPVIEGLTLPIAEYDHDEGSAIIGGYVNTGENARQLKGRYVFGDYDGRLYYLTEDAVINEVVIEGISNSFGDPILGFGEDARGNLYLMSNETGIPFGEAGTVYRIFDSTDDEVVQKIYIAYYGRPADPGGLDFWVTKLQEAGGDLFQIIDDFATSQEFIDRFGDFSDSDLIDNIYQQLFGREPDAGGKQFFLDSLSSGSRTLQTITLDILNGAQNEDAIIVANKLAVSRRFTDSLDENDFVYAGSDAAEAAKDLLSEVLVELESGYDALESFFKEN